MKKPRKPTPDSGQESVPAMTYFDAPIAKLEAALTCVAKDDGRAYLAGVYIHREESGEVRFVATDGNRLLVQSYKPNDGEMPKWLDEEGLIVPAENLKPRLAMIGKAMKPLGNVRIGYAKKGGRLELTDQLGECTFRVRTIDGKFPDYRRIVADNIDGFTSVDELPRDFEPVSFSGEMFKGVAEVAKALDAKAASVYLAKPKPAADGSKGPTDAAPSIVTFPGAPGAVLYIMPMRSKAELGEANVAILQPAIKASIAALKAQRTRNEKWAKEATNAADRKKFEADAE